MQRTPLNNDVQSGQLSPRELEVLRLVGEGLSDIAVGDALFISRRTVGSHMRNIREKLGVRNRTQAVVVAHRTGLISHRVEER